jgi:hypothetical protein
MLIVQSVCQPVRDVTENSTAATMAASAIWLYSTFEHADGHRQGRQMSGGDGLANRTAEQLRAT